MSFPLGIFSGFFFRLSQRAILSIFLFPFRIRFLARAGCGPILGSIEVKPCIHDVAADISSLDRSKIRERLENSELIQKMMRQSREIKKLVGDRKSVAGQMVGPFSGASMMVGVKEFMILLGKKSPYIKPLLEYATDCCAEIANMYCENGCDRSIRPKTAT